MTDPSIIARDVRVRGKVQGVAYRFWTRQNACVLRVAGWVRNEADGSVAAHLEGDEAGVKQLIERMREGPPAARVERVELGEAEAEGFDSFEIRT